MNIAMRETQYQPLLQADEDKGLTPLGLMTSHAWDNDPKRLGFTLARYTFVAKMLVGKQSALEIGCGDAFGTRIVRQVVPNVMAIDFDPVFVADVQRRMDPKWKFQCLVHDMRDHPLELAFEAVYALDVLEHVKPEDEVRFLQNAVASLGDNGIAIFGMPSLESQAYASEISRQGHVNCKSQSDLKATMERYFRHVFTFGMNDATLHAGFGPMCHYLLALCVSPIK